MLTHPEYLFKVRKSTECNPGPHHVKQMQRSRMGSCYLNIKFKCSLQFKKKKNCTVGTHVSLFFRSEVTTEEGATPEPASPDEIEIDVNYEPDPTDLVLSSVPGGELFDPRKHKFTDDELKPQPMIKKAKKVFVPDDQKVRDGGGLANLSVKF